MSDLHCNVRAKEYLDEFKANFPDHSSSNFTVNLESDVMSRLDQEEQQKKKKEQENDKGTSISKQTQFPYGGSNCLSVFNR